MNYNTITMIRKGCFLILCFFMMNVSFTFSDEEVERVFPPQAVLLAAYRGDIETMREILAEGADKNIRDALGATALHVAILQPDIAMVKLLL